MVRSMYSGVAGMRANQNRMDVIGNNIANANTYGFKSGRATFRDIYYQTYRGASEGTISRGGINPSNIGYGAQLASIDLMMDSASMTSTGFALDCAITGEGFFQVMDPDGNIYYTKAGMLDIDPATGAVIDSNGNFVLGTSATNGKLDSTQPGQNKIIIQLDSVPASVASIDKEIGGRTLHIESSNQNKDANISFTFSKSSEMPDGMKVRIMREGTSSVYNVQLNANEKFTSMSELSDLINDAIKQNYGGDHPGGVYSFSIVPDPFDEVDSLTGADLVDTPTQEYEGGSTVKNASYFPRGFGFDEKSLGLTFSGKGGMTTSMEWDPDAKQVVITMVDEEGTSFKGYIPWDRLNASSAGGSVMLKNEKADDPNDYLVVTYPGKESVLAFNSKGEPVGLSERLIMDLADNKKSGDAEEDENLEYETGRMVDNPDFDANQPESDTNPKKIPEKKKPITSMSFPADSADAGTFSATAEPQEPTKKCGWGKATFTLEGGCEFHTQDISNITGISIGADGIISGTTENGLEVLGRIDLATFANAKGLDQVGSSYFAESANSGPVKLAIAGEEGTGAIKNSSLEMSNVDLAQEFSDMIVTQRGFQASSRMITVSDTMLEELTNLKR